MRYQVDGADRKTGRPSAIMVEADSETEAIKRAGVKLAITRVKARPPTESETIATALDTLAPESAISPRFCENCGQKMGAMEKPLNWKCQGVCAACFQKLSYAHRLTTPAKGSAIECAACGYEGSGKFRARGNVVASLLILGITDGWSAGETGYDLHCPRCGCFARDAGTARPARNQKPVLIFVVVAVLLMILALVYSSGR